jgi:hypothetical protein
MGVLRSTAAITLVIALAAGPAAALETDPFYAWGSELSDATPWINAKVNLEIEEVLARLDASPRASSRSCDDAVDAILRHFRLFIFHDLELWVSNTSLIDRVPSDPDEVRGFRERYVYRATHELDPVVWMPPSPTIEIDGIRIGTDKLTHFFSEGSFYRRWYLGGIEDGLAHDDAVERAIRRGIWMERTLLGWYASGVLSLADLEANEQGMRWLVGMCHAERPQLRRVDGRWVLDPPFDVRTFVSPGWDESWLPNLYSRSRWAKVRPVLEGYCDLVDSGSVRERRERYRRRSRDSTSMRIVREAVAEGTLPDPSTFSIEHVCAHPADPAAAPGTSRP